MLPAFGAVPAVVGIVGAVSSGFAALIAFFATKITTKVLIVIAAVAVISGLSLAFFLGIESLADSISASLPTEALLLSSSLMPRNLSACVSVVVSAHILRWIYDKNVDVVRMLTSG